MTNIAIISGSHREQGNSHRVGHYIAHLLQQSNHNADNIDITELPLWDEGLWGKEQLAAKWQMWEGISERLQAAEAFVIITPEYCGMASPMITNFLLIANSQEVGHKPGLIVGVSASRGGAYPIAQLRSFSVKNNHLCWIPDHVIIRDVDTFLEEVNGGKSSYTAEMLNYALKMLGDYAIALRHVRESGNVDYKTFPYGM
ncbi:MAG: NADPH-dependent oxidoreductase [Spirulina sp. DLM2.Bin59]|nr:MAG: NADPH-dependent oxidoreductase [Spirulina sp. DLM2.Bin59]